MDARVAAGRVQALADAWKSRPGRASTTRRSIFRTSTIIRRQRASAGPKSIDDVDPELLRVYEKLGIPLREQEILAGVQQSKIAVDAVFDSVSVVTTFKEELKKAGVIFMSISEAMREHPELVQKYLGTVVPVTDNYYATLNAAVFTDGSFVYVPKGVRCPMELSTYFRINEKNTGQFERTLIIAEEGAYVSYLEGCTAPQRDENQLHAAVVELIAMDDAEIKYSTVQNWYPGDKDGKGGIYNFVTKRGDCRGDRSKISWTQVETGSAITWKYPSCILRGDDSARRVLLDCGVERLPADRFGTKMIHLGKNTSSRIISKGISAGHSSTTPIAARSRPTARRTNARNFTQCDSPADRQPVRRAHGALYRGEEFDGAVRARGHHLQDLRGPAVLLPGPRHSRGRGHRADRQRLRQGSDPGTADGIRR
jgi:Fe-S cluster assembly protein SufB